MKSRFCFLVVVILSGIASVATISSRTVYAQEPAADAPAAAFDVALFVLLARKLLLKEKRIQSMRSVL